MIQTIITYYKTLTTVVITTLFNTKLVVKINSILFNNNMTENAENK